MKNYQFKLLLTLSFVLMIMGVGYAQENNVVVSLDYMQAHPGQKYVKMEKEIYKPLHQHAVNNGKKLAWYLYRVEYPYGSSTKYNYVTVNVFANVKQAMTRSWEDFIASYKEVHPTRNMEEDEKWTMASRDLVKGELFGMIDEAIPGPSEKPSEYISVNYMNVKSGKANEYLEMESNVFKPMHLKRIKAGNAVDWMLFGRIYPYSESSNYQFLTVDVHGTLDQMLSPFNPNEENEEEINTEGINEAYFEIITLRKLEMQEIWKLVDYTQKP